MTDAATPCNRCGHLHPGGPCRHRTRLRRCPCTLDYLCHCGHVHGNEVCTECTCRDWGQSVYVTMPGGGPDLMWPILLLFVAVALLLWAAQR